MKQLMPIDEDNDVFEFKDEENPDDCDRWSKIRAKLANPNSDYDVQLLRKNSSGPETHIKGVLTVALDDDDDDDDDNCMDINSADPLISPHKDGWEESDGVRPMSDSLLKKRSGFADSNVEHKSSPLCSQTIASAPPGLVPGNGHVLPVIPESLGCNGSDYFGDLDGDDMVKENSPSTPDSQCEKNNAPKVGQALYQSVSDLEMDIMDTIIVHTDYVAYGENYFPASLILFSRESVKIKAPDLEESVASIFEWNLEDIFRIETRWSSSDDVAKVRIQLFKSNALHREMSSETSGVEAVEFLVPNWSHHQEQIMSLDLRYNAVISMGLNMQSCNGDAVPLEDSECSSDPYIPNFEEPFEEVVYPKGEIDAVSVRKSDVDLLLPDVFVNDTIIDFYITYLKNAIPHERRHTYHFFSSFFFRKLADLDKNPSSISDGKAAFQRVRRWTRKVNIFEKDFVFIPVNYNLHWSLIVLCHLGEVADMNDENIDKALKVPCILHMDSIRGSHAGLKDLFQSYLLEEWKERHKDSSEDVSSKFLNLRFLSLELPQQENCSDCGLFLLHYAELFIDEAPQNFSPFRINKFHNFLKSDWFMPAEASLKRVHIQRLIFELLKSLSHECASPPSNCLSHSSALPINNENDTGIEIVSEKNILEKSWNGSSLHSEPVLEMETGLLNMPIYRPSRCVDRSGLGMKELLEQHSQHDDLGASLGKQGFSISTIREVENGEHQAHSNLGQTEFEEIDPLAEFGIGYSPGDFNQQFEWHSDSCDQEDSEDALFSSDNRSCDDSQSTEDTKILECNREAQSANSCQIESMDQSKDSVESQDGYASAASDMMETPAEDSQELAEKYGTRDHEQEDPFLSNLNDAVEESEEELSNTERDGSVSLSDNDELVTEDGQVKDVEVVAGNDKTEVVEDSPPDQPRPAKKLRVSSSPDDEESG